MIINYPCKDCKERHLACHDECPAYQETKAKNKIIKKEEQKDTAIYDVIMTRRMRYLNYERRSKRK